MRNLLSVLIFIAMTLMISGCTNLDIGAEPVSLRAVAPVPNSDIGSAKAKRKIKWTAPPLNLDDYRLTFRDEFDDMSIVPDLAKGRWFAPVHVTFGAALLVPRSPDGPFFVKDGHLVIRAERRENGWTSGLMQTVDSKGNGFSQTFGYFEMRAKLPKGKATWPAFWLLTQRSFVDKEATRGEIDILEAYGSQPGVIHVAVHIRPPHDKRWNFSKQIRGPEIVDGFHRYGVSIDGTWTKYYCDGEEIYRIPTFEVFKGPMYMLVDLAMVEKDMAKAVSPSELVVDYVRAYQFKN